MKNICDVINFFVNEHEDEDHMKINFIFLNGIMSIQLKFYKKVPYISDIIKFNWYFNLNFFKLII